MESLIKPIVNMLIYAKIKFISEDAFLFSSSALSREELLLNKARTANYKIVFLSLMCCFLAACDLGKVPSAGTMIQRLAEQEPALMRLVTGASVFIGFFMAFKAIYQLKEYGELRTMMSSSTDLRKPMITFFVAIVLLYWPSMYHALMLGTFGRATPLDYDTGSGVYSEVMIAAGKLIQVIGFIAFIRGWVLLTHIGQQGAQPGMFGKALTHIFGGLLATNIFGTFNILKGTLGIG